jgi:3-methyladenine DNA glycosylase AlkD
MTIEKIHEELLRLGNKERAINEKKYLKSPYFFYGLKVPEIRSLVKNYKEIEFSSAARLFQQLWDSGNHEEMSLALFLLRKFVKKNQMEVWKIILENIGKAKTWDHIDELSSHLLGEILNENYGLVKDIKELSESINPWARRASIISTCFLIKNNKIDLTLRLAEKLVYDKDIYVQKGAGWMLREVGKKNRLALREFLLMHMDMKSAAFSYATEKMKELREIKKEFLKKNKENDKHK